ncbi:MAG: hypothetical protein L3J56_09895, partial [Bacteroidales bacterium]|nr:hypothetical protein [Bacteroidales bacterium]
FVFRGLYLNNNDPGSNVFIGRASGSNNLNGSENVYIGYNVGQIGSIGTNNVYLGAYAGRSNSGVGNVFVGSDVGNTYPTTATISNKLYIDNSNTTTPLIWGDFANDSLKVYGSFNINNAYTFPKVDGTSGQVLRTDGNGKLTWENAAKSSVKSKELILLKETVRNQQSEIKELIKENKKIRKENKIFESRLKVLENILNK